jgi:L-histidine N-alpha-methyltransferase
MEQEQHYQHERFQITSLADTANTESLARDVYDGLTGSPRSISPKYFYDERGSWLFDQICQTDEYYLTRAEAQLLRQHGEEIISTARPDALVEFGSGTADKTELLIQASNKLNDSFHYLPVDVCREILLDSGKRLTERYHWLSVDAWHGDFLDHMQGIENHHERSLYSFLGSSLGNFSSDEALGFLHDVREAANDDDWFLLGVDMVKEHGRLNAAYNDSKGYTAAFNLNLLNVLNRSLDGNFDTEKFSHHAFFDSDKSRIEMRLISLCRQQVTLNDIDLGIQFEEGEHIVTEYSRKYTRDSIQQMLRKAGFYPQYIYTGNEEEFMLVLSSCSLSN